jgi:hypothetical protein
VWISWQDDDIFESRREKQKKRSKRATRGIKAAKKIGRQLAGVDCYEHVAVFVRLCLR